MSQRVFPEKHAFIPQLKRPLKSIPPEEGYYD